MLNTKLAISTDCRLMAAPPTPDEVAAIGDTNIACIQFIVNKDVDTSSTVVIQTEPDVYIYSFPKDGLYIYHKAIVRTDKSFLAEATTAAESLEKTVDEVYTILLKGAVYYDTNTEKLMYNKNVSDDIYEATEITDFDWFITSIENNDFTIVDYSEKPVFSICELSHCVAEKERNYIHKRLANGCKGTCDNNTSDKDERDFLMISEYVLKILIRQQRFAEATDILESLETCGSLCKNFTHSGDSDCGCSKN